MRSRLLSACGLRDVQMLHLHHPKKSFFPQQRDSL